jgi:hypothetical protein
VYGLILIVNKNSTYQRKYKRGLTAPLTSDGPGVKFIVLDVKPLTNNRETAAPGFRAGVYMNAEF